MEVPNEFSMEGISYVCLNTQKCGLENLEGEWIYEEARRAVTACKELCLVRQDDFPDHFLKCAGQEINRKITQKQGHTIAAPYKSIGMQESLM